MRALGGEASAEILARATRGRWLWPLGGADASSLVAALAESPGIEAQRARVRELPPIEACNGRDLLAIARGFPNATLRLLWDHPPDDVRFFAELPCRSLQLSVGNWTSEPPVFSDALRRLASFGSMPELHAPGLRELEVASWSSGWFETLEQLAPRLERLHLLHDAGDLAIEFPRLRDLRVLSMPDRIRVGAPLERVHVTVTAVHELLRHPALGPHTRIRADDWQHPDASVEGDARIVWVGAKRGWGDRLSTLPNLEVADVDDPERLPDDVLPAPAMFMEHGFESERMSLALAALAKRGRPWRLRSDARTAFKIRAIKRVRTFSAWGLKYAKTFFEASTAGRLVALTTHEALYWQAVLRATGVTLEREELTAS